MLGKHDRVSLFGRFTTVPKRRIVRVLAGRGARALRDLTRSSTCLVIGEQAVSAIEAVEDRVSRAAQRQIPVMGERRLMAILAGDTPAQPTVPLARASDLPEHMARLLSAFDLVTLDAGLVAFKDAAVLKSAETLRDSGMPMGEMIRALLQRRESPQGRHRVVLGPNGAAMLEWEDGLTTLSGQHVLPLEDGDDLEDLFEQALDAESAGDLALAARIFETCVQNDRKDALAAFNLGNVRWTLGDGPGAKLAFQQAIARDPLLSEAHYNLAGVLEQGGDPARARAHLKAALEIDSGYADALFNLAQLDLAAENWALAERHFERYLALRPSGSLTAKAQQALKLIALSR